MREKRIWYPGAIYHIMQRGIRRNEIFENQTDYETFLTILQRYLVATGCTLHAYCLMTNHYHLLVQTGDIEIWKMMKGLAQEYAQYYNNAKSLSGHVYDDRYKSCIIQDDRYFLQVSRYIHLNPVKAGMVTKPEQYKWSSYQTFIGRKKDSITNYEKTLLSFGKEGVQGYIQFVEKQGQRYNEEEEQISASIGERK